VEKVDSFCSKCGAPVLLKCPGCNTPLTSPARPSGFFSTDEFCRRCGASFPWTSREASVAHLLDLLNNEPLDAHDQLEAREALRALTAPDDEVPEASKEEAAGKLKRYASAAWLNVAAPVLRTIITEQLQRQLGLPPA